MTRYFSILLLVAWFAAGLAMGGCSRESAPAAPETKPTPGADPLLPAPAEPAPSLQDPPALLEAGKIAYQEKNYDRAMALLAPLTEKQVGGQTEALAWQFLAQSAFEAGLQEKGLSIFLNIRKRYADDPANLRAMVMHEGNILWKNRLYDPALKTFEELIRLGDREQEPGVVLQMALVHRDAGRMKECRQTLETIVTKFGHQKNIVSDAHLHLARCDLQEGDADGARKQVILAERKGGDINQIAQLTLAIVRMQWKDKEMAAVEKEYQQLLNRFKTNPELLNNVRADLGAYYLEKSLAQAARPVFEQIVKESPDDRQKQWAQDNLDEMAQATPVAE